jgi:hypothetical protein
MRATRGGCAGVDRWGSGAKMNERAFWLTALTVSVLVAAAYIVAIWLETRSSKIDRSVAKILREDRLIKMIGELNKERDNRGLTIATTQEAASRWKVRAARQTQEVHRLRRLCRVHGIATEASRQDLEAS